MVGGSSPSQFFDAVMMFKNCIACCSCFLYCYRGSLLEGKAQLPQPPLLVLVHLALLVPRPLPLHPIS